MAGRSISGSLVEGRPVAQCAAGSAEEARGRRPVEGRLRAGPLDRDRAQWAGAGIYGGASNDD